MAVGDLANTEATVLKQAGSLFEVIHLLLASRYLFSFETQLNDSLHDVTELIRISSNKLKPTLLTCSKCLETCFLSLTNS